MGCTPVIVAIWYAYDTVRYGTVYLPYFMIYIISYDKYGAVFKNTKKFIEFIYL